MSNILKVTTPLTGYDNTNHGRNAPVNPYDPSVQAPLAPDKVVKPDSRSDAASQEQSNALKFKFESNYANFVAKMNNLPQLTDEFTKILLTKFTSVTESGIADNFAAEIAEFLEFASLSESELLGFIRQQNSAGVKFTGAFFTLLSNVFKETNSTDLKSGILEFLKRYTDMTEGAHLMKNSQDVLEKIQGKMFATQAEQLKEMASALNTDVGNSGEGMAENLKLIKDSILPFLNKYISATNDRGNLRELSTMLAAYTARAENGMPKRVVEAFEYLMRHTLMQNTFENFDTTQLLSILQNSDYMKMKENQKWSEKLISIIKQGVEGKAGGENKAVFNNLMQSILLNESVYMPLLHTMLPVSVNGKMMFGEMWVDPDAEGNSAENSNERTVQGLLKFDIESLGFFDMFFVFSADKMRMQISCPEQLDPHTDMIRNDIGAILARHNIAAEELYVDTERRSIPISEAFPQIFERKNSVNVKI